MIHACLSFLFFNDTATTEIYTLSLHDALPICRDELLERVRHGPRRLPAVLGLTVWVFVRGVLRGGGSRRRVDVVRVDRPAHAVDRLVAEAERLRDLA